MGVGEVEGGVTHIQRGDDVKNRHRMPEVRRKARNEFCP